MASRWTAVANQQIYLTFFFFFTEDKIYRLCWIAVSRQASLGQIKSLCRICHEFPKTPCPSGAGVPELSAGLQVGSHGSGTEGNNPLPHPADRAAVVAGWGTSGFPGCQHTFSAHIQFFIRHPIPPSSVCVLRGEDEVYSLQQWVLLVLLLNYCEGEAQGYLE